MYFEGFNILSQQNKIHHKGFKMQKETISDILKRKKTISFEVFPPKKDGEFDTAYEVLKSLSTLSPDFISVTYGAGGSRSKKTVDIAAFIQNSLHIEALAHMTCVGCKKEELMKIVTELTDANVRHVLALRGDRPKDMSDELFYSRDFAHASDMTKFLRANTCFHIAGACYPEKHYEASDMESDLLHLKEKQDAGAEFLITQLFFDNIAHSIFGILLQKVVNASNATRHYGKEGILVNNPLIHRRWLYIHHSLAAHICIILGQILNNTI